MSRIGKNPVPVPEKVTVSLDGLTVKVKGPKGELERTLPEGVSVSQDNNPIVVSPTSTKRISRERHGLSRTLVANMIEGVSNGYSKALEIVGVGSRAQVKGKTLVVSAGKELAGNEAAKVRAIRPPEPYKGKGIKYEGERILRKAGKSGKK